MIIFHSVGFNYAFDGWTRLSPNKPSPTITKAAIMEILGNYLTEGDMLKEDNGNYCVPDMKSINKRKKKKIKVVSTFSGCGGSCLGYKMAGFDVVWANEFIPIAAKTYKANFPTTVVDTRDIRKILAENILKAVNLEKGELDLFDGSPPCDSFSMAGKRDKHWGKVKSYSETRQRTDDLTFEYTRLLEGLKPKVFVMENVAGLVKGKAVGYFKLMLKALKDCGYNVSCRVLNAKYLDVPQSRSRCIFIGVRNDIAIPPTHPKPQRKVWTIKDALPWIENIKIDPRGTYAPTERNKNEVMGTITRATGNHSIVKDSSTPPPPLTQKMKFIYNELGIGETSKEHFSISKADPNKVAPVICGKSGTIMTSGLLHPYEPRKLTILEAKRLCSFPDDFILLGNYGQQWERLGNSVPPMMMFHVAKHIYDNILSKVK